MESAQVQQVIAKDYRLAILVLLCVIDLLLLVYRLLFFGLAFALLSSRWGPILLGHAGSR